MNDYFLIQISIYIILLMNIIIYNIILILRFNPIHITKNNLRES